MAAAAQAPDAVEAVAKQLFVGGAWRDAEGGATFDVEDPATGAVIASVADATREDAGAALAAAAEAFRTWRHVARASAPTSCAGRTTSSPRAPTSSRRS
jgi:succinate-semialdehyde dehydrogenase / glutarate-semialdehyde dehydrogenase